MNLKNAIRVGSIAGIEISLHYTWLLIFGLVSFSLARGFYPAHYPGWETTTYWITGVLTALAFFGSVLLHELGHSLVAQARGLPVKSITLFIFGGVSNLGEEARNPRDDFLVSVMGPLTSFFLAGAFWAAHIGLGALADTTPLGAALAYLSFINLLLGVFNLLPGFPLDGGRVLRAGLWAATGSLQRATDIASYVGQGIGFLLIFMGVMRIVGGAFLDGLWIAFIGWFLSNAAEATRQAQALRESLRGLRVSDMMQPVTAVATPNMTVQEFVYLHVLRHGVRALPVVDQTGTGDGADDWTESGGRLIGLVSVTDVKAVPQPDWPTTSIAEIMTRPPLKTVGPATEASDALKLLVEHSLHQLPVVQGDRLVGMINRADVLRALQLRQELDVKELPPFATRREVTSTSEDQPLRRPV